MSIGLNRTEFIELRRAGVADPYPKSTQEVVDELHERGYAVDVTVLNYLVKTGKVSPHRVGRRNYSWDADQIDVIARILEEQRSFQAIVVSAQALGFRYASYLQALKQAVEQLRKEAGDPTIAEDPELFVLHVHPPRFGRPARVSFSVCADVRAHLAMDDEGSVPPGEGMPRPIPRLRGAEEIGLGNGSLAGSVAGSPSVTLRSGMAFSAK